MANVNQAHSAFDALLEQIGSNSLPPVERWKPERTGEIDILIRKDGVWEHEGRELQRKSIAKVFSTILIQDGEDYYLTTPVEKLRIRVEDTPFVIVDMESSGAGHSQRLLFKTNMGDVVPLDQDHPLTVTKTHTDIRPIVRVRASLDARILNSVYARLADLVEDSEASELKLWSYGACFDVY